MVGVSGTGKYTWIKNQILPRHPDAVVCRADDYSVDLDGIYCWNPEAAPAIYLCCKRKFTEAVTAGEKLIVVNNTNLVRAHRQGYLDWGRKHGYQAFLVVLESNSPRLDLKPGVYYIPVKREVTR